MVGKPVKEKFHLCHSDTFSLRLSPTISSASRSFSEARKAARSVLPSSEAKSTSTSRCSSGSGDGSHVLGGASTSEAPAPPSAACIALSCSTLAVSVRDASNQPELEDVCSSDGELVISTPAASDAAPAPLSSPPPTLPPSSSGMTLLARLPPPNTCSNRPEKTPFAGWACP